MFRVDSMFIKSSDNIKGVIYEDGKLLPILTATKLLAARQYQYYFEQLRHLSRLPDEHFQIHYFELIIKFAEYVQLLPRKTGEVLGSLLNLSLERALRALFHFAEEYPEAGALECAALFSAALLVDIAVMAIGQKIMITDEEGRAQIEWLPLSGPMTEQKKGEFYRIIPLGNHLQRMERSMRLLLARQIMPTELFSWIVQFPEVFAEWLEVLEDDEGGGGRFRKILQLYEIPVPGSIKVNLPVSDVAPQTSPATEYAEMFLRWLRQAIANGDVSFNQRDSNVFMTSEGAFVDKALFKQFVATFNLSTSPQLVYSQFGELFGLQRTSSLDYRVDQVAMKNNAGAKNFLGQVNAETIKAREGALLTSAGILFGTSVPAVAESIRAVSQARRLSLLNLSAQKEAPKNRM